MTVLAAAGPLQLQLGPSEAMGAEPRLIIRARPELADVRIEMPATPLKQAAHRPVRVIVAYLR